MIQSMKDDDVEFFIDSNKLRFGVEEFALIANLNFNAPPMKIDLNEHSAFWRIC